jgi:hypothetical protein
MRIHQWGSFPVVRHFSSVQVPYFYHTLMLLPYRVMEGDTPRIQWEKRQVMPAATHFRCLAAAHFKEECLALKDPRENILIPYLNREDVIYRQLEGIFAHFRRLECGLTLLLEEPFALDAPETADLWVSAADYVIRGGEFPLESVPRLTGVVYPIFPGFSDATEEWERHFAFFKSRGVETVLPYLPAFDGALIRSFLLMASAQGRDPGHVEDMLYHRPRKEYTSHIWQRILPALKAYGLKAVPKPPQQAGTLYFNRCLAVRCFFLFHWLNVCGREIEAWRFHRLGFKLWHSPLDIRQIQLEGNLKVFELEFLEDVINGAPHIYPDEKLWL